MVAMKLNSVERAAMNNPVRAAHQHHREAAWFRRLAGGALSGQQVLEVGCGRSVGAEVIFDRLGAGKVTAFDLDESMVELARKRLHGRPVSLPVGDVCDIQQPAANRRHGGELRDHPPRTGLAAGGRRDRARAAAGRAAVV
jgi:2-polyprenyl-3-methyl-5-hydroxy-6-metoxy-1,4-benzoquinol methylase